jgi:translation initiation factor IF-2
MDRIRNTRVALGEAGGITQHIGAYTVEVNGRKITFLDTPGHAAFSAMRARGASLTDIAVIIIAADDGIMPQTREVIKQAQQAGVQIMIAINKCDLPSAKPDRVRQMLQGEGLTPEEWGGDVICAEVSAVTGAGVDHLLEMILLQADVLELMANPSRRADGYVVEAQLEQGLGPTATLLVAGGTINVGDIILCGEHFGRIRGLIDDRGRRVKSAGPATAVRCMGLSGVPEAGASFRVMLNEKRARELAERLSEERKQTELVSAKATSLDALMSQMKESQKRELAVIVKADTQGSAEAIVEALREIKSEKVTLNIVTSSIGNVSATDINKAGAGKAVVLGFSVACETGVQQQARHDGVRVSTFRIIYELLDFVKQRMLDLLPPEYKEAVRGHAEIKVAFDIGKTGRVAGCQMLDGVLRPDARYRIFRKKEKIWDGKISSLKHFQNEVSEVNGSQECGIFFNGYEDFQVGDVVECYVLEELPRTL